MAKSSSWNLRINETNGVTRDAVTTWCVANNAHMCVHEQVDEEASHPHYHIAVQLPEVITAQAMRDRLKKLFKAKPSRADFSTAPWDGSLELLWYFSKSNEFSKAKAGLPYDMSLSPDVVYLSPAYTHEDVVVWHNKFWENNLKKKEMITKKQIAKQIAQELSGLGLDASLKDEELKMRVVSALMKFFNGRVNDYVLFPIFQEVLYILRPSMVVVYALDRMNKKLGL